MPAIDTPAAVLNAACAQIGDDPIGDILGTDDEGAANAELLYAQTVEFNLGLYPDGFSWAKELRPLSVDDSQPNPSSGYTKVFDLPTENVLGPPIYITDTPTDPTRRFSAYALIAGQVHSSAEALWAMVPFRPEPVRWSATFRQATITSLASHLAMSQGHDRATMEAKRVAAYGTPTEMFRGGEMGAAIRAESFSKPPRTQNRDNNPLTNARSGGSW